MFLLEEGIKTFFGDIQEIGLNMVVFQIQYIINCGRKKIATMD